MFRVIAIDGPAGAGKSTVAKKVAERLGFVYLDTGAMYRAITLKVLNTKIDLEDEQAVFLAAKDGKLDFSSDGIILDGKLVEKEIRSSEVTKNVSKVSSYGKVREVLVDKQREISMGKNSVVDGRDIGTVVFPNAWLKIFLTASVDERANRRFRENCSQAYFDEIKKAKASSEEIKKAKTSFEEIKKAIEERDYMDSNREISPLKQATDAILLDTTSKNIDQVTDEIVELAGGRS